MHLPFPLIQSHTPLPRSLMGPSWSNRGRLTDEMLSALMTLPGTRGMPELQVRGGGGRMRLTDEMLSALMTLPGTRGMPELQVQGTGGGRMRFTAWGYS